jgi:hypothetical protein
MSEFIKSYFHTQNTNKMKFYFNKHNHQWSIHIIPVIDLYLETYSPIEHKRFIKDGFVGLYLSISWLDKSFTFGVSKKHK